MKSSTDDIIRVTVLCDMDMQMDHSGSWSGAQPYNNINIWVHLIQGGQTADGIVMINCCWGNGYANVSHGLIIISADGIVLVTSCQGLAGPWYARHERETVDARVSGSMTQGFR